MKFLIIFAIILSVTACVSSGNQPGDRTNLTFAAVKKNIIRGQTSQTEIIQLLGSPNITSKNKKGQEVWTYSKTGSASERSAVSGGFIFIGGGKAVDTTSVSTFDLIITFDDGDMVEDYSVVTSKF